MSELPVEDAPAVADAAHEAAGGKVVYITEGGHRLAAIVPADYADDLAEDLADAQAARESLDEAGDNVPWEQVRTEAGL